MPSYHQVFVARARKVLPRSAFAALHRHALAASGGHGKKAKFDAAQAPVEPVSKQLAILALSPVQTVTQAIAKNQLRAPRALPRSHRIAKDLGVRPIIDAARTKRIVYCVALEPDSFDAHGDRMDAEDIEYTAHHFLAKSRAIHDQHQGEAIGAEPVESYIAPQDLSFDAGMYGPQTVRRGSWVLGIRIHDDAKWQDVVNGKYTGISVGGFGVREPVSE